MDLGRGIFDACSSGDNAGTQFQDDCSVIVVGSTEDSQGTANALGALTPDQVLATNVAAQQQVRTGLSVAESRMFGARFTSGISTYRPGEALASQLLVSGGGASADGQFGNTGLFATVKYTKADQDQDDYTFGFDQDGWNFLVGADYRVLPNLVLGGMASYSKSTVDYKLDRGDMDVTGWGLAAYGTYFWESGLFLEGTAGYTKNDYDLNRRINYSITDQFGTTTVNQIAKADTDANVFYASLGGGYSVSRESLTFTPQLSLNYSQNAVDGYTESMSNPSAPGGSLGMSVDSHTYVSFSSRVGFSLANAFSAKNGVYVPQVSMNWIHEFANDQQSINTRFVNDASGSLWLTDTIEPDRNYFDISLGIVAQFAQGRSAFITGNKLIGYDDLDSYAITGGLRVDF
jgi:outer membrane autotransporter protein